MKTKNFNAYNRECLRMGINNIKAYSFNADFSDLKTINGETPSTISYINSELPSINFLYALQEVRGETYEGTDSLAYATTDIIVGTGSTLVTEDDYKLESELSDNLTFISSVITHNKGKQSLTKVLKNNTGAEITIKETGLIKFVTSTIRNYCYRKCSILIDRTVLDTPLVVPDGATFSVDYTMDI